MLGDAKKTNEKSFESRNMKKYDKKMLFRNDLEQVDWESILRPYDNDPVSMAATFQETFESILYLHTPVNMNRFVASLLLASLFLLKI